MLEPGEDFCEYFFDQSECVLARIRRVQSGRKRAASGQQPGNDLARIVLCTPLTPIEQSQTHHLNVHSGLVRDDMQCPGQTDLPSQSILKLLSDVAPSHALHVYNTRRNSHCVENA